MRQPASELFFLYSLAELLGKSLNEVMEMTLAEIDGWSQYFKEKDRRAKQQKSRK